jgi:hypothetical protein
MKRFVRTSMLLAGMLCTVIVGVIAAAPPAQADGLRGGHFGSPRSVFPQPRDPWRSWGVRSHLPHRVGPARPHVPDHAHGGVVHRPSHDTVWVPGHWAWNGAAWVWWPGHWGVRY